MQPRGLRSEPPSIASAKRSSWRWRTRRRSGSSPRRPTSGLVLVNARFVEIVGRPVSEILGRSYLDAILPDDLERVQAARGRRTP